MAPSGFDTILLRDIRFPFPISFGPDAWGRVGKPQPATISLRFSYPRLLIDQCGSRDDVSFTLSYGEVYRKLETVLRVAATGDDGASSTSLEEVVSIICFNVLELAWDTIPEDTMERRSTMADAEIDISIHLPKAILRADKGLTYRAVNRAINAAQPSVAPIQRICRIDGIHCNCIIGVNPHEREIKQSVEISLVFPKVNGDFHSYENCLPSLQDATRRIADAIENSSFKTVEAMAQQAAKTAIEYTNFDEVTVRVEKPSAMAYVEYSGIEIARTRRDFLISNEQKLYK
ncbi:dihydroneopterin aldolase [Emergomyces pasteurianus Ep9510]|uniref:dihydroneopterin aldolase n=1 Tax=Emergomyces pasteurianus Ep9510 TaxID=1447872 RepID=A0A1J9PNU3_9EURO|nr:dihydroneopterin aldolase [Emergomyces pasteurianus Ep9510]